MGATIPKWNFTIYSSASSTLIIRTAVVGRLAISKAIRELSLKFTEKR